MDIAEKDLSKLVNDTKINRRLKKMNSGTKEAYNKYFLKNMQLLYNNNIGLLLYFLLEIKKIAQSELFT